MYILSIFTLQRLRECGTAGALEVVDPGEGPGWTKLRPGGPPKKFLDTVPPAAECSSTTGQWDSGTVGPV